MRSKEVPRLPASVYRHRVAAPKPHAYDSVLPLLTPIEQQGSQGGGGAPWLDSDIGEHRALSSVVVRDFRMRALLSTIGDAAMLLATPIPSLAVATGEYSLGGGFAQGGPLRTPAPSPAGALSPLPSAGGASPAASPGASPAPDRRTVFALHQRAAALLQPNALPDADAHTFVSQLNTVQAHQTQLRTLGGVLRGGAGKRRVSNAMDDAAAEVARANAALLEEGGGAGALLVPRSIRMALGTMERKQARRRSSMDSGGWLEGPPGGDAATVTPMRGGGGGGGAGGATGVKRLVGAGVEDTGAPQVRGGGVGR